MSLMTATASLARFVGHGSGVHRAKPQHHSRQLRFSGATFNSSLHYKHVRIRETIDNLCHQPTQRREIDTSVIQCVSGGPGAFGAMELGIGREQLARP